MVPAIHPVLSFLRFAPGAGEMPCRHACSVGLDGTVFLVFCVWLAGGVRMKSAG